MKSFSALLLMLAFGFCLVRNAPSPAGAQLNRATAFAPHESSVLIVTTTRSQSGYGSLFAELARYGFNITIFETGAFLDNGELADVNFVTSSKTANLAQYDAIILHGSMSSALAPMRMSAPEVQHFTEGYAGVLVSIGFSLFVNETSGTEWPWTSAPISMLDRRFGINFNGVIPYSQQSYCTRNGTLFRLSSLVPGLDDSLYYRIPRLEFTRHARGKPEGATELYRFTWDSTDELGITLYENATGATGILINNQWVCGMAIAESEFRWWGVESNGTGFDAGLSKRSSILGRILAHALKKDSGTIIKPQPLMNIRLDDVGASGVPSLYGWTIQNFDSNALTCLRNFDNALADLGISCATVAGIYSTGCAPAWYDGATWRSFTDDTWKETREFMLSKRGIWDFVNHYDHQSNTAAFMIATATQHKRWLQNTVDNMTSWGFYMPITVCNPRGDWGQNQLGALTDREYFGAVTPLDTYFDDIFGTWATVNDSTVGHAWISNNIIVHPSENGWGARNTPYFNNASRNAILMTFAAAKNDHLQVLTSMTEDVASIFNHYENFYADEVGTWWLRTWVSNMTYEIPDVKFVRFEEGIQYFAKRNATILNPSRSGNMITFSVNVDNVQPLPIVRKGMLWYRIDAGQTIQGVKINGVDWFAFDDYSIRIPATNSDIEVLLGEPETPSIRETDRKLEWTSYASKELSFRVDPLSGDSSRMRIHVGGCKEPLAVEAISGTVSWNYDESSMMLELAVSHVGASVVAVDWRVPGDVDGDGIVNVLDLGLVNAHWSPSLANESMGYEIVADKNYDGVVNIHDFAIVITHWSSRSNDN